MALSLNHQQRLNIIAVLGAVDTRGRELHAIWHIQDALDLNDEEKQIIEFREDPNGLHQWNMQKELPVRIFDFNEADFERIRNAVENFGQFKGSRDRIWLEPLLAQLQTAVTRNGSGAK